MKIDNVAQLDFDDVLLKPQRTTLRSRQDVLVERDFYFYHSSKKWHGVPVMCANMSFAGLNLAQKLAKYHIITCLHKYHSVELIKAFFDKFDPMTEFYDNLLNYIWPSFGYSDEDLRKIEELKTYNLNLCIDVPNGHIDSFVDYCAKIRNICPNAIIMAGNVTDPASTQELIIHGGVDIVKTQIGPGCFISGTKIKTKNGYKPIDKIKVGEFVLTHTGEYKKVIGTKVREETESIIDINGIKCTKEHRFYVIHKRDVDKINDHNIHKYAKWIMAQELSDEYFLIQIQE